MGTLRTIIIIIMIIIMMMMHSQALYKPISSNDSRKSIRFSDFNVKITDERNQVSRGSDQLVAGRG